MLDFSSLRPLAVCSAPLMSRRLIAGLIAAAVGNGRFALAVVPVLEIVDGQSGRIALHPRQPGKSSCSFSTL
jgi:hypothetical protein